MILAAVDRSNRVELVIKQANSLGEVFNEPVHVIHVMTQSDFMNMGRAKSDEVDGSINIGNVQDAARDIAAQAANNLDVPSKAVGKMGTPSKTIVNYAKSNDAKYIIVAPRKRSPSGKALFGSTAQSILLNSEVPVVTCVKQGQ